MNIISSKRIKERKEGIDLIERLTEKNTKVLIVHYSCESFLNTAGRTPRITSISVKSRRNNETHSFSIHLIAQEFRLNFNSLTSSEYDKCESKMLEKFYKFLKNKKGFSIVHWNMRNSNFGFEAISNRYKILTGRNGYVIDDDEKLDLSKILGEIYTFQYELDEGGGKLFNLAKRNKISMLNFIKGKEESVAFDNKEYLKLHTSTLNKVDVIDRILDLSSKNKLQVNCSKFHIYGCDSIEGIVEYVKNSPLLIFLIFILGNFFWAAAEPIIQYKTGTSKYESVQDSLKMVLSSKTFTPKN